METVRAVGDKIAEGGKYAGDTIVKGAKSIGLMNETAGDKVVNAGEAIESAGDAVLKEVKSDGDK